METDGLTERNVDAQVKGSRYRTHKSAPYLLRQIVTLDIKNVLLAKCKYDGKTYHLVFKNRRKGELEIRISRPHLRKLAAICGRAYDNGTRHVKGQGGNVRPVREKDELKIVFWRQ